MRLSHLAAVTVLATTSCVFALTDGYGVGSIGPTAHVSTSKNRAPDSYNAQPGFSGTRYDAGVGINVHLARSTNPTYSGSTNAQPQVPIIGGKGYTTEGVVPGRSDPMPIVSGRRVRTDLGGIGE